MSFLTRFFNRKSAKASRDYSSEAEIRNSQIGPVEVWFEPWGMPHSLLPGESFRVIACSNQPGKLEISEEQGSIAVYAWNGCIMTVYQGTRLIEDFTIVLPDLPDEVSTSTFVRSMFGGPGGPKQT